MFENKLKKTLYGGKSAIGTFAVINSPDLVEMLALAGFDFVIIDCEHGPMDAETSTNLIRAAERHGMTPIVRVRENAETVILKHLDVGAHGIQIPQINTGDDAERAIRYAKYAPEGARGVAMARSAGFGMLPLKDYFAKENRETLVVVHCENTLGLENIEAIAATPHVDVVFFGPFDMSQSMGIIGQVNHERIQAAAQRVVDVCAKHGKIAGVFCHSAENAIERRKQGFRYLPIGVESSLIGGFLRQLAKKAKEGA